MKRASECCGRRAASRASRRDIGLCHRGARRRASAGQPMHLERFLCRKTQSSLSTPDVVAQGGPLSPNGCGELTLARGRASGRRCSIRCLLPVPRATRAPAACSVRTRRRGRRAHRARAVGADGVDADAIAPRSRVLSGCALNCSLHCGHSHDSNLSKVYCMLSHGY